MSLQFGLSVGRERGKKKTLNYQEAVAEEYSFAPMTTFFVSRAFVATDI